MHREIENFFAYYHNTKNHFLVAKSTLKTWHSPLRILGVLKEEENFITKKKLQNFCLFQWSAFQHISREKFFIITHFFDSVKKFVYK
jgi:hypothetical protein